MRRFFDTNVLVYLFDASATTKKVRAQELLKQAVSDGLALLSTQVLQEFFVAVTRKLSTPLPNWSCPFWYPIRNLVSAAIFGSFLVTGFSGHPSPTPEGGRKTVGFWN
jgi:hypothetical protein